MGFFIKYNGEIAARASVVTKSATVECDAHWVLTTISVKEPYRRKGLGTKLLTRIVNKAAREKLISFIALAPVRREYADFNLEKWYKAMGFVRPEANEYQPYTAEQWMIFDLRTYRDRLYRVSDKLRRANKKEKLNVLDQK
jgi:N-acetylglutamate synthase-like GNAT family acetyltransferase